MTLAPLSVAAPAIQSHAFAAMSTFALGLVEFAAAERHARPSHPRLDLGGADVSLSALFIHQPRLRGPWSPIHLLAIFTLVMVPLAALAAHHHAVPRQRRGMIAIFVSGLVFAGLLTFMPGRIMHAVAFGQ